MYCFIHILFRSTAISFLDATLTILLLNYHLHAFLKRPLENPLFVLGVLEATTDYSDYLHLRVVAVLATLS